MASFLCFVSCFLHFNRVLVLFCHSSVSWIIHVHPLDIKGLAIHTWRSFHSWFYSYKWLFNYFFSCLCLFGFWTLSIKQFVLNLSTCSMYSQFVLWIIFSLNCANFWKYFIKIRERFFKFENFNIDTMFRILNLLN